MAKSSSPHCTDRRRFCSTRTIHFFYAQLCHCSAPIFRDFLAIFSHFFTDFPCTFCPFFTPNAHQKCPGALLHRSLCAALREQANTSRTELFFREVSRTWPDRILRIRFEGPNVRACGRFGRFRTLIINRLALIKTIYCANRNYTIYS
uniref:(northern house mosquito) hypothetical protein n=1 Tax=Culex pipiens TaxID=7175 RepID=A0A8D8GYE0_CULPI